MQTKKVSLLIISLLCQLSALALKTEGSGPAGPLPTQATAEASLSQKEQPPAATNAGNGTPAPTGGQPAEKAEDSAFSQEKFQAYFDKFHHFDGSPRDRPRRKSSKRFADLAGAGRQTDGERASIALSVRKESYMFFGTSLVFRPHLHTKGVLVRESGAVEYRFFLGSYFAFLQNKDISVLYNIKGAGLRRRAKDAAFGGLVVYEHNALMYLDGPDVSGACERSEATKSWVKSVARRDRQFLVKLRVECADDDENTGFDAVVKQTKHSGLAEQGAPAPGRPADAKGSGLSVERAGSAAVQDSGSSLREQVKTADANPSIVEGKTADANPSIVEGNAPGAKLSAENKLM